MVETRLLPVPEGFFFDRSLQTPPLGIAFDSLLDVRSENRAGEWVRVAPAHVWWRPEQRREQ